MNNIIDLTRDKDLGAGAINAGNGLLAKLDDMNAIHRRQFQAIDKIGGGTNDVLSARTTGGDLDGREGQITIAGHGLIEGQYFTIVWGEEDANQFAFAVAGAPNGNNVPFVQLASARTGIQLPAVNTDNIQIWRTNTLATLMRKGTANALADFNAAYAAEQEAASVLAICQDTIEQYAARVSPQS